MPIPQWLIFRENNETFDVLASEQDIFNCFRLILNRYPEQTEWAGHVTRSGQRLSHVVATFVDSPEYVSLRTSGQRDHSIELHGYRMFVSAEDLAVGAHLLTRGEYEPEVSTVFASKLRLGMRVVDIGANIGFYTFLAASLVGQSGKVWAIEPNSKNVAFLLKTRAHNNFSQIEIIQAAASDRWEILSLMTDCSNGAARRVSNEFLNPVMGLPLAACLPAHERLDVVKIDVEGAEGKAIYGMLGLIDRFRPVVFSEFTPSALSSMSGLSPRDYLELFTSRNYVPSVLESAGPRTTAVEKLLEQASTLADDGHLDIMFEQKS